ncbi:MULTISPECIES: peptidylprolyl isomerase [Asticcacaulis]|uniref:peptidylprolyl isomerase n=1 Tax=Asticcacaulis TaxID=76890 RepID=UPI001AE56D4C|nr:MULTISPECIES: peptidylprolyl isomerase [Asticcacaulis]MBP2157866.1 peptidylprolyl isomerase [Asticcacaulis solisilvae]MDR6798911.1 peptidylprolyl isomerase [Asticcacaulis sp. BE141]
MAAYGKAGLISGLLITALALTAAAEAPKPAPSPQEIVDAAPASAWATIKADDLVVMKLADGAEVIYQLAPDFAPVHVANIRQLVRSGYFDGASILRVQDNYVVQWGRPDEDTTEAKGITKTPPAEYEVAGTPKTFRALPWRDAYAPKTGHIASWPAASDGSATWLVHCYGMIGVARGNTPDTGDATQLYTIIGHAPRHLDRNLAVVGRIVSGMDLLADRPRGGEALGFYKTDPERVKIVSARMASDIGAGAPSWQVMDTASPAFDAWVKARASRSGAFFVRPANALDICNAQAPLRKAP